VQKGKGEKKIGRMFYTQASAIPEGEPAMMGMFSVAKHDIPIMGTQEDFFIQSPEGRLCTKEMVRDVPIELGGHIFPTSMIIL
jgi:hypothetical protein